MNPCVCSFFVSELDKFCYFSFRCISPSLPVNAHALNVILEVFDITVYNIPSHDMLMSAFLNIFLCVYSDIHKAAI